MFKDNEILRRIDDLEKQIQTLTEFVKGQSMQRKKRSGETPVAKEKRRKEVKEEWRTIKYKGAATPYEVSTFGNLRRKHSHKQVNTHSNDSGKPRLYLQFYRNGKEIRTTMLLENAVARTFIDPNLPLREQSVKHIDGNIMNCAVDNLYIKKGE